MKRRQFLTGSIAAPVLAAAAAQQSTGDKKREYYALRRYHLQNGPQHKLTENFLAEALIPGLNRIGISPVGAFSISIGPESPAFYVLIPSTSAEALTTADFRLEQDAEYMKTGTAFLNAPAKEPAFDRIESSLLQAFEKWPRIVLPAATAARAPRIFELRIYEGATDQDHKRKVEMMQAGEAEIFAKAGVEQVFYRDTLIGTRLPNLTYMLAFNDLADRDKKWAAFRASDEWKSLSSQPRYAFETIVSNITNLILTPTAYSQI